MDAPGIPAESRLGYTFRDGELRNVRIGNTLILSRLYAAVRDENWGTVPMVQVDGDEGEFVAVHEQGSIRYRWQGRVLPEDDGFTFRFEGEALTDFRRSRIGFCLLFPAALAGTGCAVERTDGDAWGEFPQSIDPVQPVEPFTNLRSMSFQVAEGEVSFEFRGDEFEMEDQRNWTDASFKVFCTPLGRPYPVRVQRGERVVQEVRIRLRPGVGSLGEPALESLNVELGEEIAIPSVGCLIGGNAEGAHFVRIDADPDFPERFELDIARAEAFGLPIELGLLSPGLLPRPIRGLVRVIAAPHRERLDTAPDYAAIQAMAARWGVPVVLGTDSDYVFLNRYRPHPGPWAFAINPQVHAFDDASIFETPAMHGALVRDAMAKGATAVHVTPVTFLPRHNPYSDVAGLRGPETRDPREATPMGEAWKLASLAALASNGAKTVTFGAIPDGFGPILRAARWFRLTTPADVYGLRWEGEESGSFLVNARPEPLTVSAFGTRTTISPRSVAFFP